MQMARTKVPNVEPTLDASSSGTKKPPLKRKKSLGSTPTTMDKRWAKIEGLHVIQEVGIDADSLFNTDIPGKIHEMGWHQLVAQPRRANISIVREFYYRANPHTFMDEGVLVRGRLVQVTPRLINNYFGVETFRHYHNGFPRTAEFQEPWDAQLANEIREYPLGAWLRLQSLIDHRELGPSSAFWNVFQAKSIWPRRRHQELRDVMPKVILCIRRGAHFDVGQVICRNLQWHLLEMNQIVFPSLLTYLCEHAGITVSRDNDEFLPDMVPLGLRVYNRLCTDRHLPHARGPGEMSDDEEIQDAGMGGAGNDGDDAGVPAGGVPQDPMMVQILAALQALHTGQQEMRQELQDNTAAVRRLENRMKSFEDRLEEWSHPDDDDDHPGSTI